MAGRSTYGLMHDETEISEMQLGDKAKEWVYSYSKFLEMNGAELFCKSNFIVDNGP